jgi:uncharacterized LabA/DUF88 family protein
LLRGLFLLWFATLGRVALFVDAGYLLAGAHDLLGGSVSRSAFDCDYERLLPALRAEVEAHGGALAFLRTYWYDGARDGIPTSDHRRIGDLPYVKVRLGRLNRRGQQKGVDGLIYRDLTALARAGAIERAYLFTGDEDIRESVATAQDLGVQVVLMTFHPTRQTGHSAALVREVDEALVLTRDFWEPHFRKREDAPPPKAQPDPARIEKIADEFAEKWAAGATTEEILELLNQAPRMPQEMYVQLLLAAEASVGSLRPYPDTKGDLRRSFLKSLKEKTRDQRRGDGVSEEDETGEEEDG